MTDDESGEGLRARVLGEVARLKGVTKAFYLSDEQRERLAGIESERPDSLGPLKVHNEGVLECLRRRHVVCIVKDRSFRPPPAPTVVLLDEGGKVVGRELIGGERPEPEPGQKLLFLGKDFVIFYDGGKGSQTRFVLPPVRFEEVEGVEGARNVCSSSPSTDGDFYLRESADLPDDPELATILVGFD